MSEWCGRKTNLPLWRRMISSPANERTSSDNRWQCPCNDATWHSSSDDGSCGADKDFLSPFYLHCRIREGGGGDRAKCASSVLKEPKPIPISPMTAWKHSSSSSDLSSSFFPGCQKRPAVKVRATNSMSFTPLFARRLGLGYFLAENVAWNGWEMGPPIWRRIEGLHYNDDSDTTSG